jgi:hypothetical protein
MKRKNINIFITLIIIIISFIVMRTQFTELEITLQGAIVLSLLFGFINFSVLPILLLCFLILINVYKQANKDFR